MLSEVNVKASIQCHYSRSWQEKGAGGFSSQRKKNAFSAGEDGLLARVCVCMFVELNALFGAPTAPEDAVYFSSLSRRLWLGVGAGQPKSPGPSCGSGGDLCRSRCDGDLSAIGVA